MTHRRAPRPTRGQDRDKTTDTSSVPAGSHTLQRLQRSVGNAAVVSLIARDVQPAADTRNLGLPSVQRAPQGDPRATPDKPTLTEEQYALWRRRHPKHDARSGGTWEPDYLYKRYTPAWFTAQGYVYALRLGPFGNIDIDVWIDDRGPGREFRVIRWTDSSGGGTAGAGSGAPGSSGSGQGLSGPEKGSDLPVSIDPNADYDKLFGPPIARKEGIDAAFGEGNMVLHEDGSLVLYLDDGGQYVFRPVPGGRYVVYDPKGKRLSHVYELPPGDIPDVDDDADR